MTRHAAGRGPAIRAGIAVLAVLLYAGVSSARWVRRSLHGGHGPDEISLYEHRLEPLRRALPPAGTVGYLGDPDPAGPDSGGASAALLHFRRYLLTQYSLAPLLVLERTAPEFVIGNFDPGTTPVPPPGFHQVGSYGDGLVLFRRAHP